MFYLNDGMELLLASSDFIAHSIEKVCVLKLMYKSACSIK